MSLREGNTLSAVAKVIGSILRSLFVSIVMFVIVLSVMTGQFPPDFGRLRVTFQSMQDLVALGQKMKEKTEGADELAEEDVQSLEALNAKRRELGEKIFAQGSDSSAELKARVQELQVQLFRLQQRVAELEEAQKKGSDVQSEPQGF